MRLRGWNSPCVQLLGDRLQRKPVRVVVENPSHDDSLWLVDFEPHTVGIFSAPVAKAAAARVKAAPNQSLKAPANTFRRVRKEELIDHPACEKQKLEFVISRIDSLGDEANFHSGERKVFAKIQDVSLFAGKSRSVFNEQRVERPRSGFSGSQECPESRTVQRGAGDLFVRVNVLFEKLPSALGGELAALGELIFGREWVLPVGRVPGVGGGAQRGSCHGCTMRGNFASFAREGARLFSEDSSRSASRTSIGTSTVSMNSRSSGSISHR
ncbi:MAG TPA: hypothetical protein VMJ93_13405 [Verrucomicrobiae bacterium]|nr:hypothetical protein [Verrucomicrobiae bacterium]